MLQVNKKLRGLELISLAKIHKQISQLQDWKICTGHMANLSNLLAKGFVRSKRWFGTVSILD